MDKIFAIVYSEKNGEEAVRDIILKLKLFSAKELKYLICLFTPHYQPFNILKTFGYSLKYQMLIAIQAPELIYEDKILEKGIIACCINKEEAIIKDLLIKSTSAEEIESNVRMSLKDFHGEKHFLYNFVPPHFNAHETIRGLEMALGKAFNISGGGFTHKFAPKLYNVANKTVDEGLINIIGRGLAVNSFKISGFLSIGKPFTVTKVLTKSNIISEINNEPAVEIYKKYLEEKFSEFQKNNFFPFYPLKFRCANKEYLITPTNCLEDGSLVCLGNINAIKENSTGHISILHAPSLLESLDEYLYPVKEIGSGLVFMVNSTLRKKILKDSAREEIIIIKRVLGNSFGIIGFYSDYTIYPDKETRDVSIEAGNLMLTTWT